MEVANETEKQNLSLKFDPRTKLLLLVTISMFLLGGMGGEKMEIVTLLLSAIPFLLLIVNRHFKAALVGVVLYIGCYGCSIIFLPITSGMVNYLLLFICGIILRFMPGMMAAYFVLTTTTVSEFVAAMERLHVTEKIVIPMSVVFRFFPTVLEEMGSISDAMRMRGIRFGGGKASEMLEYRIIPMMNCSLKIGEELSAAALTRGLGAPIRRTNICEIGFHLQDILICIICGAIFSYYILESLHVV